MPIAGRQSTPKENVRPTQKDLHLPAGPLDSCMYRRHRHPSLTGSQVSLLQARKPSALAHCDRSHAGNRLML